MKQLAEAIQEISGHEVSEPKILLISRKSRDCSVIRNILESEPYRLFEVSSGNDVLAQHNKIRPDLIIMDDLFEDEIGFDIAQSIKQSTPDILTPIIYISSSDSPEVVGKCLENGGVDIILCPFHPEVLLSKISTYCTISRLYHTEQHQRDSLEKYNAELKNNYEIAESVFRKVMHSYVLEMPAVKYSLSPIAIFNGDVLLAAYRPTGELQFILGDFTGHGLSAAIGAIPVSDIFYGMTEKGFGITDIIQEINLKLKRILPLGFYLAACLFEYEPETKKLSIWNAGLPDALIFNSSQHAIVQRFSAKNFPLGIHDHISFADTIESYLVQEGDIIIMYTDGVTEARNSSGEMYGMHRLLEELSDCEDTSLVKYINEHVRNFARGVEQADDRTLLQVELSEVCKNINAKKITSFPEPVVNSNWKVSYSFGPEILRHSDPLPTIIQSLMEIQKIHKFKQDLFIVLKELFTNSLDHGLLRLDSTLKQSPEGFSRYLQEKQQRLLELQEGIISIEIVHRGHATGGEVEIFIYDTGQGFDVQKVLEAPVQTQDYHGRGIHLVKRICHALDYQDAGRHVHAIYKWSA